MSGCDALKEEMDQRLLSCKVFPLDNPMRFENALGILVLDVVFVPLARTSVLKGGEILWKVKVRRKRSFYIVWCHHQLWICLILEGYSSLEADCEKGSIALLSY